MQDAPPSYDALDSLSLPPSRDEKTSLESVRSVEFLLSAPTHSAPVASSSRSSSQVCPAGSSTTPWWRVSAWTESPAAQEVRKTLVGLVHDLVRGGDPGGVLAIVDSCADACKSYGLSLSSILQERSAAGHTSLYWAIVNRTNTSPSAQDIAYFRALLAYAAPLSTATVDDVRLACLHSPNNTLFQCLRRFPSFSPLSAEEKLIMGQSVPLDEVHVRDSDTDVLMFSVEIKIPMFQKRMRIAEVVEVEFIAKGRLWQLSFLVARKPDHRRLGDLDVTPGRLAVKLALLAPSPPTRLDSTLIIKERVAHVVPQSAGSSDLLSGLLPSSEYSPPARELAVNPPIEVQLQSIKHQLIPDSGPHGRRGMVAVSLEKNDRANTLQVDGCPYVGKDDTLVASLDGKLDPTS